MKNKQKEYYDVDGNYHFIDTSGNHFMNGKCINPKSNRFNFNQKDEGKIGDTHLPEHEQFKTNPLCK